MKKQLMAIGLATILTVPTWLTAANPLDVSAKKKVTVNKKTKAVITKIKALNAKKSDYIKKTQAAQKAYNKLSKKDKKKVSNYKTLKKHTKAIKPLVAKANKFKKDVNALSKKNYAKRIAGLQKRYKALNKTTKGYVPKATVTKLNYYAKIGTANTSLMKVSRLALSTSSASTNPTLFTTAEDVANVRNGQAILDFINAYEKLNKTQKLILGGSQDAIDYLLALKPIVTQSTKFDATYTKLDPKASSYLKAAYDLYNKYDVAQNNSVNITYDKGGVKTTEAFKVGDFAKNHSKMNALPTAIGREWAIKKTFEDAIDALPGTTNQFALVNDAVAAYKAANLTTSAGKKLYGKPIDIVEKAAIAEYKKYENIPSVVAALNNAAAYDSKNGFASSSKSKLEKAGYTADEIDTIYNQGHIKLEKSITTLATAVTNYNKLGSEQKDIVDTQVNNQQKYSKDAAAIKKGQTISKAYTAALSKNDLAAMLKQFDTYKALTTNDDRAIRYVAESDAMSVAPVTYATQIQHVADFETAMESYATKANIENLIKLYKIVEKDKPSGINLISSKNAKDYALAKTIIEIDTLMTASKPTTAGYTTKKLNNILAAIKLYGKLDKPKKAIVDVLGHNVDDYAADEKYIKEAMKIDASYLAIKPAAKTYTKDARTLYNQYTNANVNVKKYIVNAAKIASLQSVFATPQSTVDAFDKAVNEVYKEVYNNDKVNKDTVNNIKTVINTYDQTIKPYAKFNNLVDADTLKKYKALTPIVDVYNQIFNLKASPSTEKERDNIITAAKAFAKLDSFGKKVIEIEDKVQSNLPLLDDEKQITEAKKIDAAYKLAITTATKADASKVQTEISKAAKQKYDVYLLYKNATADIQKYVLNAKEISKLATTYANVVKLAKGFTDAVNQINRTSAIIHVHELQKIYEANIKGYPEFEYFLDADTKKKYKEYIQLLKIQNVAQVTFDAIFFNGDWVKYDHWFYTYSQSQDHEADVWNMREALLIFNGLNPIQRSIINNSPNYEDYTGLKEDNKGNNIPVYNVNTGAIESYEKELGYNGKFAADEVIYNPIDWLNQTQVNNVLAAMELEKRFNALKAGSKSYGREAMKIVEDYNAAGEAVQMYFLYTAKLKTLESTYKKPLAYADTFEAAVKAFEPNTGKVSGLTAMKAAYKNLDAVGKALVDTTIMKTYDSYIAAEAVYDQYTALKKGVKTMANMGNIATFVTAYNKLPKNGAQQKIINNSASDAAWIATLATDATDIKNAQAVDKKFVALDKTKPTYEADVIKLYDDYVKLTNNAKNNYIVNGQELIDFSTKYASGQMFISKDTSAKATAEEFERVVAGLTAESPYKSTDKTIANVHYAYELYTFLKDPQTYKNSDKKVTGLPLVDKAMVTKYNLYAGLPTIYNAFAKVTHPKTKAFTVTEKAAIQEAIAAYKKLPKDAKFLFENDAVFGAIDDDSGSYIPENHKRYLVLAENDIKAAEKTDAAFLKIKKGDKSFVLNTIVAMKSYNGLSSFQKKFFTQTSLYNTYKSYDIATSMVGKVDTIPEAVLAITTLENLIREANEQKETIIQTEPGSKGIPSDQAEYTEMFNRVVKMKSYYDFLNQTDFVIEGQKVNFISNVFDSGLRTDYIGYIALYGVNNMLVELPYK